MLKVRHSSHFTGCHKNTFTLRLTAQQRPALEMWTPFMPQAYEAISNHNSTFSSSGVENFTITETFTGLFDHPSYILEVERMSKFDIRDCEYLLLIFANANSEYLIEYIIIFSSEFQLRQPYRCLFKKNHYNSLSIFK